MTLAGHERVVKNLVAAAPDGRIFTASWHRTVKLWRDGACVRTIEALRAGHLGGGVLPGGARFVSGNTIDESCVKLWTLRRQARAHHRQI